MWKAQQFDNDNVNKVHLGTSFQEGVLEWYMRYVVANPTTTIYNPKKALNEQFQNPKSYVQCVIELKDIH